MVEYPDSKIVEGDRGPENKGTYDKEGTCCTLFV